MHKCKSMEVYDIIVQINYILNILHCFQEFSLEQDYNRMTAMREYIAHQGRVTGVVCAKESNWVLSIGRDKQFYVHCTESGRKIGTHQTDAWYTALQYPFYYLTKNICIARLTLISAVYIQFIIICSSCKFDP